MQCPLVAGYAAPAPAGACAVSSLLLPQCRSFISRDRSSPKRRHRTLFLCLFVPVTQVPTRGGCADAWSFVGDRHYEGQLRVLHGGDDTDDIRSGIRTPIRCFKPDGKHVCVRHRHWLLKYDTPSIRGGEVKRRAARCTNTGHRNEDIILAEMRSTTSSVFWPRSDRHLLPLRVGDRALASWTPSVRMCAFGDSGSATEFHDSVSESMTTMIASFISSPLRGVDSAPRRMCRLHHS